MEERSIRGLSPFHAPRSGIGDNNIVVYQSVLNERKHYIYGTECYREQQEGGCPTINLLLD